jgi:hypothetical protein
LVVAQFVHSLFTTGNFGKGYRESSEVFTASEPIVLEPDGASQGSGVGTTGLVDPLEVRSPDSRMAPTHMLQRRTRGQFWQTRVLRRPTLALWQSTHALRRLTYANLSQTHALQRPDHAIFSQTYGLPQSAHELLSHP